VSSSTSVELIEWESTVELGGVLATSSLIGNGGVAIGLFDDASLDNDFLTGSWINGRLGEECGVDFATDSLSAKWTCSKTFSCYCKVKTNLCSYDSLLLWLVSLRSPWKLVSSEFYPSERAAFS
jgi:hypothetical protein